MNGNQITISVNSDEFNQLRTIARTRGQTVSDYISCLVSSNLQKSGGAEIKPAAAAPAPMEIRSPDARRQDARRPAPTMLKTARARAR